MHRRQQQNQRGQDGSQQLQPIRGAPQQNVVGIFPLPEGSGGSQQQNAGNDVIRHDFQTFPRSQAAVTPRPAEQMLVTQTAVRISKGAAQPRALRTAATLAGIS